jgi:hypothetical protein
MTIYHMYTNNGNRAGFWVQHRTWSNTCAQVQSIAGQRFGKLPGIAPLHDHAEVHMSVFDVRSGRPMQPGPGLQTPQDRNYRVIAEPSWYRGSPQKTAL